MRPVSRTGLGDWHCCTYLLARLVVRRLAVEGKEGTKVKLGRLEQLNLPDVDLFLVLTFAALSSSIVARKRTFWRG